MKLYDVVLADPPWYFKNYSVDDPHIILSNSRGQQRHYATMTESELSALHIPAAKDSVLFLWTPWPYLPQALRVIESWGFEYKTLGFEWWKLNRGWNNIFYWLMPILGGFTLDAKGHNYTLLEKLFFFGMGYYTRANSELCLLATRGCMPVAVHNERNFIIAPIREHSRKPDEQYLKIERLYPGREYLEMFARRRRHGWDVFGNQVKHSITIDSRGRFK